MHGTKPLNLFFGMPKFILLGDDVVGIGPNFIFLLYRFLLSVLWELCYFAKHDQRLSNLYICFFTSIQPLVIFTLMKDKLFHNFSPQLSSHIFLIVILVVILEFLCVLLTSQMSLYDTLMCYKLIGTPTDVWMIPMKNHVLVTPKTIGKGVYFTLCVSC